MTCLASACRHTASISAVCMSQMTADFFFSTSQDTTLKLWTIQQSKSSGKLQMPDYKLSVKGTEMAHKKDINTVTVSQNDKILATGSQDKTIKVKKINIYWLWLLLISKIVKCVMLFF